MVSGRRTACAGGLLLLVACGTGSSETSDAGDGPTPQADGEPGVSKDGGVRKGQDGGHDGGTSDGTIPDAAHPRDARADQTVADVASDVGAQKDGGSGDDSPQSHLDAAHDVGVLDGRVDAAHDAEVADAVRDARSADAHVADSASDAGTCSTCSSGQCGTTLSAFTGTSTPGWTFNGNATYDTTTNTVVLVDGTVTTGQAGTLIYDDPITVDSFSFTFDFLFTTVNGRADGIAFMLETNGPTALGGGYGGFGVLGLDGYGVELDIFDSGPCDPGNGNHAGVDLLSSCATNGGIPGPLAASNDLYDSTLPNNGVGDIGDGTWRTETLEVAAGQMSVMITDSAGSPVVVSGLQGVTLPGFVSGTPYYLGLGGGSGSNGLAARAEIRNINLTFSSTHCL